MDKMNFILGTMEDDKLTKLKLILVMVAGDTGDADYTILESILRFLSFSLRK